MRYLTALLLLLAATVAYAGSNDRRMWSGNSWLTLCQDYPWDEAEAELNARCEAYLDGVIDAMLTAEIKERVASNTTGKRMLSKSRYCLSKSQPRSQYVMVVNKYMKEHPEHLHGPAADMIDASIAKAFPCLN